MRRFGTLFRTVRIRPRLLATFLLVSIIPIVAVGIWTSVLFSRALNDQVANYSSQLVAQVAKNMSETFDRMVSLTENLIVHPSVQAGLKDTLPRSDLEQGEFLRQMDADLSRITYRDGKVTDTNIFRLDNTLLFNTGYTIYRDSDLTKIQMGILQSKQNMHWTVIQNNWGNPLIVLGRRVYDVNDTDVAIGSLVLMLDEQTFARKTYYGISMGKDAELSLISRDGTVISSARNEPESGTQLSDAALVARLTKVEDELPNAFFWKQGPQTNLICATAVPQTDWILMARIPNRVVEALSWQVVGNIALVCLLVLAAVSFLASAIFASLQHPLDRLANAAREIQRGDFDVRIMDFAVDEVGVVSQAMDEMVARLRISIDEIRRRQEEKRRVELEVLQSQINPHFLFNTLDSLKWTAMLHGNHQVGEGIGALSSLLRNGVLVENQTLSLEDEIKNLRNYALVLKLRYGDTFRLEVVTAPETLGYRLPKLLLQPFVENAIVHGVTDEAGALVTITLTAAFEGDSLIIRIEDDGQGFDMEAQEQIDELHDPFSGIGISNVRERIRLWYGETWGVDLVSRPGQGTKAAIRLPAEPGVEEE